MRGWLKTAVVSSVALGSAPAAAQAAADPQAAAVAPAAPQDALLQRLREANRDIGRIVAPNGIDEARFTTLGGARQWITIRGQDRDAPVLLFLHGGPGGALSDISYIFQRPWEDYFTVVQWDQRGFGRSAIDGAKLKGTLNFEQYIADAIELIEQLKARFGQRKIVLMGQSWGTSLGVEVAHRRPDLLHALVSIGQVVDRKGNFEETRRLFLADAKARGDAALLKRMTDAGPPPADFTDMEGKVGAWLAAVQGPLDPTGHGWHNFTGPQESWSYRIVAARDVSPSSLNPPQPEESPFPGGAGAKLAEVWRSSADWSIRKDVGYDFQVPVIIFAGSHDWQTPTTLAKDFFQRICAPYKMFVEFANSAHVVHAEEPGRTIVSLVDDVLPATRGQVPAGAERCTPKPRSAAR